MKIVVAVDSFKGSLSSNEIGKCVEENIHQVDSNIEVVRKVLADGGEGTVEALCQAMNGKIKNIMVHDAYGHLTSCAYGIVENEKIAIIEVAEAIGIAKTKQREPLKASTYGVGEVINACIKQGIRKFIVGLGGSATNDAGIGMMEALGLKVEYEKGAFNPLEVKKIDASEIHPLLNECTFLLASDVTNPLCGPFGATAIFGPQKGVEQELVPILDKALLYYSQLVAKIVHKDCSELEGAGAAGGLGFAFLAWMNASFQSGIDLIIEKSHLEEDIKEANLVITGEGCIDQQTSMGKAPSGICKIAKKYQVPVIGIGGSIKEEASILHDLGMTAYFSIQTTPMTLEKAMEKEITKMQIGLTIQEVTRLFLRLQFNTKI